MRPTSSTDSFLQCHIIIQLCCIVSCLASVSSRLTFRRIFNSVLLFSYNLPNVIFNAIYFKKNMVYNSPFTFLILSPQHLKSQLTLRRQLSHLQDREHRRKVVSPFKGTHYYIKSHAGHLLHQHANVELWEFLEDTLYLGWRKRKYSPYTLKTLLTLCSREYINTSIDIYKFQYSNGAIHENKCALWQLKHRKRYNNEKILGSSKSMISDCACYPRIFFLHSRMYIPSMWCHDIHPFFCFVCISGWRQCLFYETALNLCG